MKETKSQKKNNITLYRRMIELLVFMGYNIEPYLFQRYSSIDFDKVSNFVKELEKEQESMK